MSPSAQPDVVASMVARGVMALTGKTNAAEAWRSLVQPQDVVGVKVHASPGSASGTQATLPGQTGFGSFAVADKPERQGRNPRTGEPLTIAAHKTPKFKAGANLKAAVNA